MKYFFYLFFLFPAYLLYFETSTFRDWDWGFDYIWALIVFAAQLIATALSLTLACFLDKPRFPTYRKIALYALLESFLSLFISGFKPDPAE